MLSLPALAVLAGCAAQPTGPKPVSMNETLLRVSDEKPVGYPKHFMEKVPSTNLCWSVSQDWRPDIYNGYRIWFRNERRETVNCPAGL